MKNNINYDIIDRDKYYDKMYLKNNSNINFNTIYSKINTEYDNQGIKESGNYENDKNIFLINYLIILKLKKFYIMNFFLFQY